MLLKDILKPWQQIKLEGNVDNVLDDDLAMLRHSSAVKEQREAVQSKLNSSYASLASKPSSIAPLCISMILKQLSDANECYYLPQVAVTLPVVSLCGLLIK